MYSNYSNPSYNRDQNVNLLWSDNATGNLNGDHSAPGLPEVMKDSF